MIRRSIVLVVLASVVLAGCAGQQGTGTPTAETPTEDGSGVEIEDIPGVSNGTLTDPAALVRANGATIVETGGRISATQSSPERNTETLLTVGSGGFYTLSTTSESGGESGTLDYYRNGTATYVRMQSDGETQYRVVERDVEPLANINASVETYLAAGTFTVANESIDGTTAVFTASEFTSPDDRGFLSGAESLSGRLVLSEYGQIQNLTITGEQDGQTVTFDYELRQPVIERATQPAWVGDVPPSADLHPELSIDVEEGSYLTVQNSGGDRVPRNATLSLSANETSGTVTFDTALAPGETRYAYFAASDGSLTLATEQPSPDATASIDSPASVTVSTDSGVSLYSASMGWSSASASAEEGTSDSSGSAGGSDR
jgi:hypothetical protein